MRRFRSLAYVIFALVVIAALGALGAAAMMASIISYHSPLHSNPPAPGDPLGLPLSRKVVIVMVDGLRLDTSLRISLMPFMNDLRSQGAFAEMHSRPPSFSQPGYATILTGAWPDINDSPPINLVFASIPAFTQDDLFSAAHRSGLTTAISASNWFEKFLHPETLNATYFTSKDDAAADADVMQAAGPMLKGGYSLVLIHLDQVDYAGHHLGGPLSPAGDAAAKKVDDYLGEIASHLDFKQDTLIVLSDHGHIDPGGHGGPEPVTLIEPFVMVGANIKPGKYEGIQQVDAAPTVATLLGINLPASAEGGPLTAMLDLPAETLSKALSAGLAQKQSLYLAYTSAIGAHPISFPISNEPAQYIRLLEAARSARLSTERIWRAAVAAVVGVLPAVILVVRKVKKIFWTAMGAVLYALIFNFRYAILDGHTYSLSWLESASSFLIYMAVTSAIALIIAWVVIMARQQAFQQSPRRAAQTSLALIHMTVYILALPVLVNFAVNGLLTTWTLPEFYTIFIALLSFIQILLVVVFGLLLTGVIALITRLMPHSRYSAV